MNGFKVIFAVLLCAPFVLTEENICLAEGVNPNDDLLPHESNCQFFFKCDGGKPVLFSCPVNLEFNPATKECDWPENAGCGERQESVSPCKPSGAPVCPPHVINKPAVYFPHETDCRKFYQCDWEVPYMHTCPDGLHFSPQNKVCDWPWRAKCIC